MKCCEACFQPHANPLKSLTEETAHVGNCDLCDKAAVPVWEATELIDAFSLVVGFYEPSDAEGANSLATQMQLDWSIFTVDDAAKIHQFLDAVFAGENGLVQANGPARLRRKTTADGAEVETDHASAWDRFAHDLKHENRFFPTATSHLDFYKSIVGSRSKIIDPGVDMFRARVCEDEDAFPPEKMSMPPWKRATAGRANPPGIPHLYAAMSKQTCIRESRAVQHNLVTVATFQVVEELNVLDLHGFKPLDPFEVQGDAAEVLDVARTIQRLGSELQKPIRPTDNEVEYVPTQYLAALVQSLRFDGERRLDGILYSSSLDPGGVNVVLFNDAKVSVQANPELHVVTSMTLETELVQTADGE